MTTSVTYRDGRFHDADEPDWVRQFRLEVDNPGDWQRSMMVARFGDGTATGPSVSAYQRPKTQDFLVILTDSSRNKVTVLIRGRDSFVQFLTGPAKRWMRGDVAWKSGFPVKDRPVEKEESPEMA